MAKRGRRGTGKALVTKSKLFKVDGMDEVLAEISNTMNRVTAQRLKQVYVEAAKVIWSQVKRNIASLPVSDKAKEMLDSMMMINQGKPTKQNVLSGMSQAWGIRQLSGKKSRFEYRDWERRKEPREGSEIDPETACIQKVGVLG